MPLPIAAYYAIGAAVAGGIGYLSARKSEKKQKEQQEDQQEYNTQMYERQREDALSDWNMQNEYNSPQQQMQRLREAGLNPHLIYGKGAENTAAAIRASSSQNPSLPPLQKAPLASAVDEAKSAIASMSGLRFQKAQTDNLYSQRALQDAQTAATLQKTAKDKFDLEQADRAKDIAFEQLLQNYLNSKKQGENLDADTNLKNQTAERLKVLTPLEAQQTAQTIENLKVTNEMTQSQITKMAAETQAIIDGNMRANELQQSSKELLILQVNEMRQKQGLDPITMPELEKQLELLSSEIALKKFELEFQDMFRKLGSAAQAAYLAAMIAKLLTKD